MNKEKFATSAVIYQMAAGTFIVGLSPIFWDLAREASILMFAFGLALLLYTFYTERKHTNERISELEKRVKELGQK